MKGKRRETLENLSQKVGVPITEYVQNKLPVINGKKYGSYDKAYHYLYGILRNQKVKEV